jgi:hypothetical protein
MMRAATWAWRSLAGATRKKYGFWLKFVDDSDEPTIGIPAGWSLDGPSTERAVCVVSRLCPSPVTATTFGSRAA